MLFKCSKHHAVLAGWRCTSCSATLCAHCTGWKTSGTSRFELCARCGGFAKQILVPRGELSPFSIGQLFSALRWPFSKLGLLSLFASGALITAFSYLGSKAAAIAAGATLAYLFQVVRHTANGKDDFPGPEDFQGYFEDVIGPFWRLTVALAWIWVPALVWVLWHRPAPRDPMLEQRRAVASALRPGGPGFRVSGLRVVRSGSGGLEVIEGNAAPPPPSPEQLEQMKEMREAEESAPPEVVEATAAPKSNYLMPILLVVFGLAIAPMSLIASSLKTPLLTAANPIVLAGYAFKLGRDYLLLVCFFFAAALFAVGVRAAGMSLAPPIPFGKLPVNMAVLAVGFIAFRAVGLLVRARGGDLGYGGKADYLVPVLGDEEPRHEVREAAPAEPAAPPQALDLPEEEPSAILARLVAKQDVQGCIDLIERSWQSLAPDALSAGGWMDLAKSAQQRGKGKAAVAALRRCLETDAQGPLAPKALLLAARIYDEDLKDRKTSDRLLQELIKRFPNSQEGSFAARRLAAAKA